jgi:hypothetical protein
LTLRRLARFVAILIVIWIAVGIVALVLFHWGGDHPDSGKGEPIGLSRTP